HAQAHLSRQEVFTMQRFSAPGRDCPGIALALLPQSSLTHVDTRSGSESSRRESAMQTITKHYIATPALAANLVGTGSRCFSNHGPSSSDHFLACLHELRKEINQWPHT